MQDLIQKDFDEFSQSLDDMSDVPRLIDRLNSLISKVWKVAGFNGKGETQVAQGRVYIAIRDRDVILARLALNDLRSLVR
jgi:hypothetical protein